MKASFLLLDTSPVQVPVLTTLQITDGRQGKVEAPRDKGRAFQVKIKEAKAMSNIFIGMYSFIILSI